MVEAVEHPPELSAHAQPERPRSLRKAAYLTAGMGMAHALLFLLAFWLISDVPGPNASSQQILDYYASDQNRRPILVGLYVMPFAGIAFIWFIVALRMWTSGQLRQENVLLSNVQLVSGILYIALFFGGAAASSVLAASVQFAQGSVDPDTARQFPQLGSALVLVFGMRMAAMFVVSTTNITRSVGIIPRWFAIIGFVVGLGLLLSATFNRALVLVFPVWILVFCALLIRRAHRIPDDVQFDIEYGTIRPIVQTPNSPSAQGLPSDGGSD